MFSGKLVASGSGFLKFTAVRTQDSKKWLKKEKKETSENFIYKMERGYYRNIQRSVAKHYLRN